MHKTARSLLGGWRRVALLLVLIAVVAAIGVYAAEARCEWGTFAYTAPLEDPADDDYWRFEAIVLIDGEKRSITGSRKIGEDLAIQPVDVALSPDGEQIVVTKFRIHPYDEYADSVPVGMFVYDVDGSGERRLTEVGGTYPEWSPDGETIAFRTQSSGRGSGGGIAIVDAEGGEERRIFTLPPSDLVDPPILTNLAWSSDSQTIAFVVTHYKEGAERSEIWTVNVDGSDPHRVLVPRGMEDGNIDWSPDGQRFAYEGYFEGTPSAMIVDADGGAPQQVEPNSQDALWSKDGDQLAYVIGHEGHYLHRFVVGDSEGRGEKAVPGSVAPPGSQVQVLDDWVSC